MPSFSVFSGFGSAAFPGRDEVRSQMTVERPLCAIQVGEVVCYFFSKRKVEPDGHVAFSTKTGQLKIRKAKWKFSDHLARLGDKRVIF